MSRLPSTGRVPSALRDDIPLARRTVSPALRRTGGFRRGLVGAALLLGGCAAVLIVFPQPLRRLLAPPPVEGLSARPGLDGRLLGHFPYGEATAADLVSIAPGVELHADAAEALVAMQQAARAEGIELRVLSAFRSIATQKHIFFDVKSERNQSAQQRAQVSAPPGYSEHSTGYAVDLGDARNPATNLSVVFENTAAFTWLQTHANRFHYRLSFPVGNGQGVSYEPWHWRFEGSAEALKTFESAQRLDP